jgi:hypothetical protein
MLDPKSPSDMCFNKQKAISCYCPFKGISSDIKLFKEITYKLKSAGVARKSYNFCHTQLMIVVKIRFAHLRGTEFGPRLDLVSRILQKLSLLP